MWNKCALYIYIYIYRERERERERERVCDRVRILLYVRAKFLTNIHMPLYAHIYT